MAKGALFVISAPSGAGKSTLIERARPLFPDMLYSVSCTTRSPRNREVHGIHYYFEDRQTFEHMVSADELLEWKEVHGNLYGTPLAPVLRALREGRRMILDIDVQGAQDVFCRIPDSVGIFITVPDVSILEQRLRKRGTDSEESISTRLANAPGEIIEGRRFHHVIVNDDLNRAVEALANVIRKESALRGLEWRS